MCGIVGVTGDESALALLLDALGRLEYRGYDSAGVVLHDGKGLWRRRRKGRISTLASELGDPPVASAGIGHTRWATHGEPSERNAHPHLDCAGRLALVHNGIVENHRELRASLERRGHAFHSETDSEVLVHVIEDHLAGGTSLLDSVRAALRRAEGSLAIVVVHAADPGLIVAARRGSPLVIGRTAFAALVASDLPALLPTTRELYALGDDQVAELRPGRLRVTTLSGEEVAPDRRGIGWDVDAVELGAFPDYMLKEIHEQPKAVAATLGGRRRSDAGLVPGIPHSLSHPRTLRRIVLVGCGTSLHAALAARPAFEEWAGLSVECELASEFRYRRVPPHRATLVAGISQSGETVDTMYALRAARELGLPTLSLTNVPGSALTREADAVLLTRAGPEMGVAATKTHVAQVVALQSLALSLAAARGALSSGRVAELALALRGLPVAIERALDAEDAIAALARRLASVRDVFFLGRGPGHAVALEGALKLKEIAYVRAEAYAAGEMKHGPIALIEPGVVVVGIGGTGELRAKMLSNLAEMKARGATVILVTADHDGGGVADEVLRVPALPEGADLLRPVLDVVPLQLLAYYIAKELGRDVDKPRNLAKTVTVE
ncbi:MAG: glutamine--fructose-6-phosphate transaminase (isomerizing) [Actinomycetota bacterium]